MKENNHESLFVDKNNNKILNGIHRKNLINSNQHNAFQSINGDKNGSDAFKVDGLIYSFDLWENKLVMTNIKKNYVKKTFKHWLWCLFVVLIVLISFAFFIGVPTLLFLKYEPYYSIMMEESHFVLDNDVVLPIICLVISAIALLLLLIGLIKSRKFVKIASFISLTFGCLFVITLYTLNQNIPYSIYQSKNEDYTMNFNLMNDSYYLSEIIIDNTSLSEIIVPAKIKGKPVTGIDKNIFKDLELEYFSVELPGTIKNITSELFSNTNVSEVIFNSGTEVIGTNVFYNCGKLKNVTFPSTLKQISSNAFASSSITSVDISMINKLGQGAFENCSGLRSVELSSSLTEISSSVFNSCVKLSSIELPKSIINIGDNAFKGCTSLYNVSLPDNVISIGSSAFEGCTGLSKIIIPDNVTSIGASVFKGCTGLTNITIPDGVNSIGTSGLEGCTGLKSITIPDNVTSIGASAFKDCIGITSIVIPNNVKIINPSILEGCTGLISITLHNEITSIGASAFEGCTSITNIALPDNVTSIGASAFKDCTSLINIDIPSNVTIIGESTFDNCTSLTNVTLGNSLYEIKNNAFRNCSKITTITFYTNIINQTSCFADSKNIKELYFYFNDDIDFQNNFFNLDSLESVFVSGRKYSSNDGVVYSYDKTKLIFYPNNSKLVEYVMPSSVTSINDNVFLNKKNLESVTLSDVKINSDIFKGCTKLNSISQSCKSSYGYEIILNILLDKNNKVITKIPNPTSYKNSTISSDGNYYFNGDSQSVTINAKNVTILLGAGTKHISIYSPNNCLIKIINMDDSIELEHIVTGTTTGRLEIYGNDLTIKPRSGLALVGNYVYVNCKINATGYDRDTAIYATEVYFDTYSNGSVITGGKGTTGSTGSNGSLFASNGGQGGQGGVGSFAIMCTRISVKTGTIKLVGGKGGTGGTGGNGYNYLVGSGSGGKGGTGGTGGIPLGDLNLQLNVTITLINSGKLTLVGGDGGDGGTGGFKGGSNSERAGNGDKGTKGSESTEPYVIITKYVY